MSIHAVNYLYTKDHSSVWRQRRLASATATQRAQNRITAEDNDPCDRYMQIELLFKYNHVYT
jgi:hypothetical protein